MRRSVGVAALLLTMVLQAVPAAADDGAGSLSALMADAADSFDGTAALIIDDPASGYRYAQHADLVMPAASLYKLGVMVEAYRRAAAGDLSLDDTQVTIEDEDTEEWCITPSGATLSVREALELAITWSDNSAARALLRVLDAHQVNATFTALGLTDTRINTALPEDEQLADFNTTTARDMERLLLGLSKGTVVGRAESREMLALLGRQHVNDRLPAGLPDGTPIAHKTGNLDSVAHDVGIIATPFGPRVVVLMTEGWSSYDDVVALAARVAQRAYYTPLPRLVATLTIRSTAASLAPGTSYPVSVLVSNASAVTWDGRTAVVVRWRDPNGRVVNEALSPLPALAPGRAMLVTANTVAPFGRGWYSLEAQVLFNVDARSDAAVMPVEVR